MKKNLETLHLCALMIKLYQLYEKQKVIKSTDTHIYIYTHENIHMHMCVHMHTYMFTYIHT